MGDILTTGSKAGLGGFHDFSGLQTSGANPNPLCPTTDHRSNGLKIGIKPAVGAIVGVTYAMSELRALAAYIATFRHLGYLLTGILV